MSDEPHVDQVVKIEITMTRNEQAFKDREWVGKEESETGFAPQVLQVSKVNRTILEMSVKELNTQAVVTAILENSEPLV